MYRDSQKHTYPEPCRLTLVCRLSCTPSPGRSLIDTLGKVSSSIFSLESGEVGALLHTPGPGWTLTIRFPLWLILSNVAPESQLKALLYLAASAPVCVTLGPI